MGVSASIRYITPIKEEYVGMIIDSSDNYFIFQSGVHRFYVYEKDTTRQFGDFLLIKDSPSEIDFAVYESQFDFNEYLFDKGIRYELSSYKIEDKLTSPIRIKAAKDKFLNSFDVDTKNLLNAFLFSNRSKDTVLLNNASSLNLLFLISASGIYISFIMRWIKHLFRLFFNEKIADTLPLIILAPFFIFIFPKAGIIRVFSVYSARYVNEHFLNKRFDHLSICSLVALTLLSIDPTFAYQSAFILGFSLTIFVFFISKSLHRYKKFKAKLMLRLFIYLFMIPVSSLMNGTFHPFLMIYQTILIPLNEIYLITAISSLYVVPFIHVLPWMSDVLTNIYLFVNSIDINIPLGYFGDFYYVIYYALFFIACDKYENKDPTSLVKVSTLLVLFVSLSFLPIRTYLTNAVYFINVGQGDSILIQNRTHAVLIDTGGNLKFDMAKETLIPFFKKRQIYYLDSLITTHGDFDHDGAAPSLIENFPVKNYLTKKEEFPYKVGDIYLDNLNDYSGEDENDSSLVFNLDFMNKKWLLTGDASINVERRLIEEGKDIDCDIIKVGHHGSNTSSCDEFIRKASPEVAIISCGKRNKYKHPHKEVIDILNKYHVEIRRTDIEGTIMFQHF